MKFDYIERDDESKKNGIHLSNYNLIHNFFYGQCIRHLNRNNELNVEEIVGFLASYYIENGSLEAESEEIKSWIRDDFVDQMDSEIKDIRNEIESRFYLSNEWRESKICSIVYSAIDLYHKKYGNVHNAYFKDLIRRYVELKYRRDEPAEFIKNEFLIKKHISAIVDDILEGL